MDPLGGRQRVLPGRILFSIGGARLPARSSATRAFGTRHALSRFGAVLVACGGITSFCLTVDQCRALTARHPETLPSVSRDHRAGTVTGSGEYKYFTYPLPRSLSALRSALYPISRRSCERVEWKARHRRRYPRTQRRISQTLSASHGRGTTRQVTFSSMSRTTTTASNHDIYGEHIFPLQIAKLLSAPDRDFTITVASS